MISRHHLNTVDFHADIRRQCVQPFAGLLIFLPLSRLGDVSCDQDAVSDPARYTRDDFLSIRDQLLFRLFVV